MKPLFAAVALLASACFVESRPRPPPPRIMPAQAAVDVGASYARSHGLVIDRTVDAFLDRRARWHVQLAGAGGRDRATVIVDGYSGRVLRARLRGARGELPQPAPPGEAPPGEAPPPLPEPAERPPEPNAPPPPPPSPAPPPPPAG